MATTSQGRIHSLDILKGLVMIVMALDHTRDYFHFDAFFFEPTDPEQTNLFLFTTRWITHFCAPAFSFLAGISAFLVGRRKTKKELSSFLLKRGLWLVLIEFTIVNFAWQFDIHFEFLALLVIWSLGISMILLAGLIHLNMRAILWFSMIMIFGHNLLDYLPMEGTLSIILHKQAGVTLLGIDIFNAYPIIPWVGVMSLGYYFGRFYDKSFDPNKRRKLFSQLGIAAIVLFVLIRGLNGYGNPNAWTSFETGLQTLFSFMNPSKYPPSLTYLLMTLGPSLLFLGLTENWKNKLSKFIQVYGKVPFFYYILHLYVIHLFAMALAQWQGFGWRSMILDDWVGAEAQLRGYGISIGWTWVVWIAIVLLLYPLCKWFGAYKLNHKEKWWLHYL